MTVHEHKLFRFIDPPTPDHLEVVVEEALKHIQFPWHRIIPGLRTRGKDKIDVVWGPLTGLLGSYTSSSATITILRDHPFSGMPFTFVHEVGHAVDFLSLTEAQRKKIREFWTPLAKTNPNVNHDATDHACDIWNKAWVPYTFKHHEAFAEAFVAAFCPVVWGAKSPFNRFVHWPVDFNKYMADGSGVYYHKIREFTLEVPIMAFTDIEGTAHEEGINWAAGEGIIGGYPDGTFKPNNTLTRGQFCTMLKKYNDLQGE